MQRRFLLMVEWKWEESLFLITDIGILQTAAWFFLGLEMKRWCGPSSTSSCNLHCLSASLFFISFLIGFKFGFRQFTKTFQIWFLDKPFAMLDFMDLTLHVHVIFLSMLIVNMLRCCETHWIGWRVIGAICNWICIWGLQQIKAAGERQFLRSFYAFHFWRFRHMIFFSCRSLFGVSGLNHKHFLAEVCWEFSKFEISCSTSPPGGNQVDGLPPVSSWQTTAMVTKETRDGDKKTRNGDEKNNMVTKKTSDGYWI